MKFDRYCLRKCASHPAFSEVDMYVRTRPARSVLSVGFSKMSASHHVLVACNNELVSPYISRHFGCKRDKQWMFVAKHISDTMRVDLIVLMNTYCNLATREQEWDVHYYTPGPVSPTTVRSMLLSSEQQEAAEDAA